MVMNQHAADDSGRCTGRPESVSASDAARAPGPAVGGFGPPGPASDAAGTSGPGLDGVVGAGQEARWATVASHSRHLLGEDPHLTLAQMAEHAGVDVTAARHFWRAMGFADASADTTCFTRADADALSLVEELHRGSGLRSATLMELLRAQSYTMDRLVLWELESLVADVADRYGLDDTSARLVALDQVGGLIDTLGQQLTYVWGRHLAALLERTGSEVAQRGREEAGPDLYPLIRSLGFVDIVSFTQRAQGMGRAELSAMINDFESTARDVITSRGARVVKTIGDAVMYISEDLEVAADVVTALVEELQSGPDMMLVRASLVSGRVVSRSGDVFGPTVNLASRLVSTAEPGGIRMDESTARALRDSASAGLYEIRQCHDVVAKGLGTVTPWSLRRR